jgi:negative regulator of sigma E activity
MLNEQLSAWCDGEHSDLPERSVPGAADGHVQACEVSWLIGDVLRGDPVLPVDFTARVMKALEVEPVVLVPKKAPARSLRLGFSTKWMPIAAAVSGVFVAAWMASSVWSGNENPALLSASTPTMVGQRTGVPQSVASRVQVADQAYLLAHQASSTGAPMADVVHYIRTVGDEQQDLGK